MKDPGPFRVGQEATQAEDHASLVLSRDLDRGEEEQDDDQYDCSGGDQPDFHQLRFLPGGRRPGSYDESQVVLDLLDANVLARDERRVIRRARAPQLPVDGHEPVTPHDSLTADEPVHADGSRASGDAHDAGQREAEQQRQRRGDRDCDGQRHLVRVARRVEEDQRSQDEHDAAGDRECAVRRDERLRHEERGGEDHQQQAGERDRQHLEPVQAEDQRDRPDRPGKDEPGVPELDDDPDEADREHERDQVRVDEQVARSLPEAHLDLLDLGSGGLEHPALRDRLHAVDLAQERGKRGRDHVDQPDRSRPRVRRSSPPR